METSALKKFAQDARKELIEVVSTKVDYYLNTDSVEIRAKEGQVSELKQEIQKQGKEQLIEKVAYTWFNRFCALRFMDVNGYTPVGILSPAEGHTQPEMFLEAKEGQIRDDFGSAQARDEIVDLISGKTTSSNPQAEAYRKLLVLVCNYYNTLMPFLFEKLDHYTELLLPDDLLSEDSIIEKVRETINKDNCQDVEIIGWLYQFYISEKKDEVFAALKKKKEVTPENIPAATQLFTPGWIVKYLVDNSLGRLWMLNNPSSNLIDDMEYYIKPEKMEKDFLKITSPEEIKICDPACGSGHMLTYAFDLLYLIYEEKGYAPSEIPTKILTNNLFGIEIDERAGELAAFALTMKARSKQRSFFRREIRPNVCVLENITFEKEELKEYMDFIGIDLFTGPLRETLAQFEETNNFGSLINPKLQDVNDSIKHIENKNTSGQIFLHLTHQKVLQVLKQSDYLSSKYHVVVANPPYMGGKGMNSRLGAWAKDNYKDSKSDLFAMFIERNLELSVQKGLVSMITMQSWMFLSSFEKLRNGILSKDTILSMAHIGTRGFDSIGGEIVSTTAFVLEKSHHESHRGQYLKLIDGRNEKEKEILIKKACFDKDSTLFFNASASDFKKIPGSPVAYWVSENVRQIFTQAEDLESIARPCQGMATTNNDLFLRRWFEVEQQKVNYSAKSEHDAYTSKRKWFPYNKGGGFRKWYGNNEFLVNFENNGQAICDYIDNTPNVKVGSNGRVINRDKYFMPSVTWSFVSSAQFGVRYSTEGFIFDIGGSSLFPAEEDIYWLVGFLCSKLSTTFLRIMNPTLNYQVGNIATLPIVTIENKKDIARNIEEIVAISKNDWDMMETSWDFSLPELLLHKKKTLEDAFNTMKDGWHENLDRLKVLEEKNNKIFIDQYDLNDELTPDVSLSDLTLFCNPSYRYKEEKQEGEFEERIKADTVKEFISYAVGCMFGRYSLDKAGLILAGRSETLEDFQKKIRKLTFVPDEDNVIPILESDWFTDDITSRFKDFLKASFGKDNFDKNLSFLENAVGKDIRKYFVKDFYNNHVKMYKKRPIYWMFSSSKGSFSVLIYMHRYTSDQVSIILNDYLREFKAKIEARKSHQMGVHNSSSSSQTEKTKAIKEIEKLKKVIVELDEYEKDILYPLAAEKVEIDFDDGVKVNYPKFGKALKKIPGLS
jgi:type II restriction/modification system DNA methylase subunit YeeA